MINANSRYLLTDTVRVLDPVEGTLTQPEYVDLRSRVSEQASDDVYVTVDDVLDWAHLGVNYLGDAKHWWVIADLSGIVDPFAELTTGARLRVPSVHRFLFEILAPDQTVT